MKSSTLELYINNDAKVVNEINKKLYSYAKKIEKKYNFLEITTDKFYEQILKSFKTFAEENKDRTSNDNMKFFESKFNDQMRSYMHKLMKSKHKLIILNNLININIKKINNKFTSIHKLFKDINHAVSIDECIDLIKTNKELETIIEKQVKTLMGKNDFIFDYKLDSVTEVNTETFLEAYCDLKDITIFNTQEIDESKLPSSVRMFFDTLPDTLLTKEEEKELFHLYSNGDMKARNKLIEYNIRLVIDLSKKYNKDDDRFLETIENGILGLIKAVDKYDINNGSKFSTYATWWINQSINRERQNTSRTIRIPVYADETNNKINKYVNAYNDIYGVDPTPTQIAKELHITEKNVILIMDKAIGPTSLDSTFGEDDNLYLIDIVESKNLSPEQEMIIKDRKEKTLELVNNSNIKDIEKEILLRRNGFYDDRIYTLAELADMYGGTNERIRKLENNALRKIRTTKEVRQMSIYVEADKDPLKRLDKLNLLGISAKNRDKMKSLKIEDLDTRNEDVNQEPKKTITNLNINKKVRRRYNLIKEEVYINIPVIKEYENKLYHSLIKQNIIK